MKILYVENNAVFAAQVDLDGPLFRPVKNPITGTLQKSLSPTGIYYRVVKLYAARAGVTVPGFCIHLNVNVNGS